MCSAYAVDLEQKRDGWMNISYTFHHVAHRPLKSMGFTGTKKIGGTNQPLYAISSTLCCDPLHVPVVSAESGRALRGR